MSLKPKKKLGQNFIIDQNMIKKIVDCVSINQENEILEIGAGTGNLTDFLIKKKPKKIYLVEKDKNLTQILRDKFGEKTKVFNEDILKFSKSNLLTNNSIIFGNLPYNISSQILTKFIYHSEIFKFKMLVFMFQKELADRIIAQTNSSDYGRLSIISRWKFNIKKAFDINPNCFFPAPKVKSSLLIFMPKNKYYELNSSKNLEHVTNIFFNQRRKMIKKPLKLLFKNYEKIAEELSLDLNLRPQNLSKLSYYKICSNYEKLVK